MSNEVEKDTILIVRMYAGKYLEDNIGHEIINTYKTDNGKNYIYVCPNGVCKSQERIKYVLLVRSINTNCFEVLAYAGTLTPLLKIKNKSSTQKQIAEENENSQRDIIKENNISYGGVKLNELFSDQDSITFVTFKADKFKKPKEKIYICDNEKYKEKVNNNYFFIKNTNFSKQSLRMYFSKDEKKEAFECLNIIIENAENWENENNSQPITKNVIEKAYNDNILDIIGKTYDELTYSNWIAYYLKNDANLMNDFLNEVLTIKDNIDNMNLFREYKNIDLWLENHNHIIVIENKIKSSINGIRKKENESKENIESQLKKYIKIAEEEGKKKGIQKSIHCYIFLPNYKNNIDLEKYQNGSEYTLIYYNELSEFFKNHDCKLPYYEEFKTALEVQARKYEKDWHEIINERFVKEILKREEINKQ